MRTLKLQAPQMQGEDVSAWQQFLVAQSVYNDIVDGVFGSVSDEATIAYQKTRGLGKDGVVGALTFAQGLLDGFIPPAGTVAISGMDSSVNCRVLAPRIAGTGRRFAVRYYSKFPTKTMTRSEAVALSKAGLQVAAVYEDSNDHIQFFSAELGSQNAATALKIANDVGQPAGSAIYFAVDFDPDEDELNGPVSDYFDAVANAFAASPVSYSVGVYGSGLTCRLMRDAGFAPFTWLSNSTGFAEWEEFREQAHLLQAVERKILGGQLWIDDDIAQSADFGAFQAAT